MAEETGGRKPFADRLAEVVRDVVDDIRQKVVEEPWFGRPVTEKLSDIHVSLDAAVERSQGHEQDRFYGRETTPAQEPEPRGPERDHGIDR